MRGAERLVASLEEQGLSHVFMNPGTTELELLRALEDCHHIEPVLVAQELVATGAADGYARFHGLGAVLLHLGPGFSNGAAFVHDAKRARSPMIVIVGEHPKAHLEVDAPLNTDLVAIMAPFCVALLVADNPRTVGLVTRHAGELARSLRGPVGIIAPQDVMASDGEGPSWPGGGDEEMGCAGNAFQTMPAPAKGRDAVGSEGTEEKSGPLTLTAQQAGVDPVLLLGSSALSATCQWLAWRIADHLGGRVYTEVFPALMERGRHVPLIPKLPYFPDQARTLIGRPTMVILVGAQEPVAYFAEENRRPQLIEEETPVVELVLPGDPAEAVLVQWAQSLGIAGNVDGEDAMMCPTIPDATASDDATTPRAQAQVAGDDVDGIDQRGFADAGLSSISDEHGAELVEAESLGAGKTLTLETLGLIFARSLQSNDVVIDEGRTSSGPMFTHCGEAPPHWYLGHPGGAIGGGLGLALGAAIATRRRVRALVADGGALYAPQALWSMAHLGLDVGIVIAANGGYRILRMEMMARDIMPVATQRTTFEDPLIDYIALAAAFGVDGERATTADELAAALERRSRDHRPFLVVAELATEP